MKQKNILPFNATTFDPITMHWMVSVIFESQNKVTKPMHFLLNSCLTDASSIIQTLLRKTLLGVVIDWSDCEAKGLKLAVDEKKSKSVVERLQSTLYRYVPIKELRETFANTTLR